MDLHKLIAPVVDIAKQASTLIEESKNQAQFSLKPDGSFVSQLDIQAESQIRAALQALTPDIPVFGEELGSQGMDQAQRFWLIDPIDGTAWYRMGTPLYGSLIALVDKGEPVIGTVCLPGLNTLCYAAKDYGCYLDEGNGAKKITCTSNAITQTEQAIITASGIHGTSVWLENGDRPWRLDNIYQAAKLFKFSGDCIQHLCVASGKVDAAIDTIMKPWDSAALIICLQQAGATVMDLDGNQTNLLKSKNLITAATKTLALDIITRMKPD